jgi:zinc-ribbon domain
MSEHGATECPRCGEPAVGTRFCPSCGLKLGSSPEMPTRPAWEVRDVSVEAFAPPQEDMAPPPEDIAPPLHDMAPVLEDVPTPPVVAASTPVVEAQPPDWWETRDADPAPGEPPLDAVPGVIFAIDEERNEPDGEIPPVDFRAVNFPPVDFPPVDFPPVDSADEAQPAPLHHMSRPVAEPWTPPRSRGRRVAFLCLVALLALVVFVPTRRARR